MCVRCCLAWGLMALYDLHGSKLCWWMSVTCCIQMHSTLHAITPSQQSGRLKESRAGSSRTLLSRGISRLHSSACLLTRVQVVKVQSFMDRNAGISKGCGLIQMATHEQAQAAISAMDGQLTLPVSSAVPLL